MAIGTTISRMKRDPLPTDNGFREKSTWINNADPSNIKIFKSTYVNPTTGLVTWTQLSDETVVDGRLSTLESNNEIIEIFESITSGTGSITIPTHSVIREGQYSGANGILVKLSSGYPIDTPASDVSGQVVTIDLLADGSYSTSGTPTSYPVAIVYQLVTTSKYLDEIDFDLVTDYMIEDVAEDVYYDNADGGLTATNVKAAIDELALGGGSSSPLTTKGDIYVFGTNNTRLPAGSAGQVLSSDASASEGLVWVNAGTGDVGADAVIPDNTIVRGDGGAKKVQGSGIGIDDSDNMTAINSSGYTPITSPAHVEGKVFYDSGKKALSYYNEESDVTVNLGQEVLFRVYNNTGSTITNGSVITNTSTGIQLADNRYKTKANLITMATHDIEDGTFGYSTRLGEVGGLDTSMCAAGTTVYLGTNGGYSTTRPDDGHYSVIVGACKVADASVGIIQVNPVTSQITVEVTDTNGFPSSELSVITLGFVDGTRTFTITPSVDDFHYYQLGDKYEKSSAESVVIDDTEGLHAIYYDAETLTALANPSATQVDSLIRTKSLIAYIYWDATNSVSSYFADERHGISMSPITHAYLHFTRGAQYSSGLGLGDFVISNGDDNEDAQFSIASGMTIDEDLPTTYGTIASTVGLPIYYLSGTTGDMRRTTQAGFSMPTSDGTSATRLVYNEWTGTTWQLTEATSNDFVLCHVFAVNGYTGKDQQIAIIGQGEYLTLGTARAAASTEISAILLGFPFEEIIPIGTVIFQTNLGYANDVNAKIVQDGDGNDYVDWRTTELAQGTAAASHNNLTNLELAASGITWGHIDDQAQTIAGVKTFSSSIIGDLDGTAADATILETARTIASTSFNGSVDIDIDHDNLIGIDTAGTGVTYGHISNLAQSIYGIKTFNSFPVTPSSAPTADYQAANKKYVDDNAGGSPLTTKGDLFGFSTVDARIPIGTNDQVLTADSAEATGVKWANASGGFTDPMTTRGDLIYKNASAVTTRLGVGTINQVLQSDGTDFSWQSLSASDVSDFDTEVANNSAVTANTAKITGASGDNIITNSTTTRTLALTDKDKYIRFTSASATTCTVPPNSSVAFAIGTEIELFQAGAGELTFAEGVGVTINSDRDSLNSYGQYNGFALKKIATDEWDLVGGLS